MTQSRRSRLAWPAPRPPERRVAAVPTHRHSRVPFYAFGAAILGLVVAVAILFVYVLGLKSARDEQAAREQAQINSALCQVISQFPPGFNDRLDHVRDELNCPSTTAQERP